jgi:hypothetical protein
MSKFFRKNEENSNIAFESKQKPTISLHMFFPPNNCNNIFRPLFFYFLLNFVVLRVLIFVCDGKFLGPFLSYLAEKTAIWLMTG